MTFDINKPAILLDLDQTLIASLDKYELDLKTNKKKMKNFNYENMDGYYTVFERPHLQAFLNFLFSEYNVSIWTAASKDYALFIIDKILLRNNPERKIDFIFFSYHCKISKRIKNGTKDLSMLWSVFNLSGYNKNNTIILDDYEEVYDTQPDNTIIAKPFDFLEENSENDTFLLDLIPELKKIKSNFKLKKSISKHIKRINNQT